jgi:peptidoglycan/LPS O-acetylase OafA/YrhL
MALPQTSPRPLPLADPARRLPALDGLRGFMLVLVMLVHFRGVGEPLPDAWWQQAWRLIAVPGIIGLDVFFVLSGFLITRILLESKSGAGYFTTFYWRRALRILPLYYGFLVVYFIVLPRTAAWADTLSISGIQHLYYWTHTTNIGLAIYGMLDPAANGYPMHPTTGHLWSLAVEEQFYFIWPVMVFLLDHRGLRRACVAAMILAPLVRVLLVAFGGAQAEVAHVLTPARLDGLAIGGLFALLALEDERQLPNALRLARPIAAASVVTLGLILFFEPATTDRPVFQSLGLTATAYVAAWLVLTCILAARDSTWTRLFGSRILAAAGQYSYGTYVLHVPLMFALDTTGVLRRPGAADGLRAELVYASIMVTLAFAAGALSWYGYERQFLKLRNVGPGRARPHG